MSRIILALIVAMAASMICSDSTVAQQSPGSGKPARADHRRTGARNHLGKRAIIRWTSTTPVGSDQHLGVVHFGTDPENLSKTAKSPLRLNRAHPTTIFECGSNGLEPGTTYYYTIDSMRTNGTSDGLKSPVNQFTTLKQGATNREPAVPRSTPCTSSCAAGARGPLRNQLAAAGGLDAAIGKVQ